VIRDAEPVPPIVKEEAWTLSASSPVLVTVIVTVIVSPTSTVAGVADIEDVSIGAAKTKLENTVKNNIKVITIDKILFFIISP